jgi:hypothetical protein
VALAFALEFEGRKRWHDADAFMADIVAKRLVRHLQRAGYVVMKRRPARRSLADWARLSGVVIAVATAQRRGQPGCATSAAC